MASMSPSESTITTGQIAKFLDLLTAGLRKSGLQSEPTQQVLETQADALVTEFVGSVRKRVDAISDMIVRRVRPRRTHTLEAVLNQTGREQYVNKDVLKTMPRGEGEEVDVFFFQLKRYASPQEVAEAYAIRGLKPDPIAQARVNEDDPTFADERPNASQWQDSEGRWCYAAFGRWGGGRSVGVDRRDGGWGGGWFFGGVRK